MNRAGIHSGVITLACVSTFVLVIVAAEAQLPDITQAPNAENAGIQKSLEEQIGAGRGDINTAGSSLFIINRDPFRAIRRGRQIFQRKFTFDQGLGPLLIEGGGNIEITRALGNSLMDSCAGCHANPRGSAGSGGAVMANFPDHRRAPALFGVGIKEMLADEITADLRVIRDHAIFLAKSEHRTVTFDLSSKGINYGRITALSDGTVDTSQVRGVNLDLRVRPLFAEGRDFSVRELAVIAWRNVMGLVANDPDLNAAFEGGRVVTPSGLVMDGSIDTFNAAPVPRPQFGETAFEIPLSLVDFMEFYLLHYFKPGRYQETATTRQGRQTFAQIGCKQCHKPDLQIERDRRVADVETVYDPQRGIFNTLFATATTMVAEEDDNPPLAPKKLPLLRPFLVKNIFTDFKRHDVGENFYERRYDGTIGTQFITPPLWAVGNTPPYGHDGRSINLREVILRHGGEAQEQRDAFAHLSASRQDAVIRFLESLIIFPPEETASNLDAGDPSAPGFPQRGHGSIRLPVLFNDPTDLE